MKRVIFAWALLIGYMAFIYATLGSIPLVREWLEKRYGEGVFATVTYIGAGIGGALVLGHMIFGKKEKRILPYLALIFIGLFLRHAMRRWITIPVEQIHFIEYGVVGFLCCNALRHHLRGWGVIPAAFLLAYFFGMVDESIQGNTPSRVGAQQDMYWNGLAAAMGLWVVVTSLRPQRIKGRSGNRELAASLIIFGLCLPVQAFFNIDIAQFGRLIRDPQRGVTFRSRFSPVKLHRYTDHLDDFKMIISQVGKVRTGQVKMAALMSQTHDRIHEEALVHISRRGRHEQEGHNFIVFKESLIIGGYFRQFVIGTPLDYPPERMMQLEAALGDTANWPYESPVAEHLITKFTKAQMWGVMGLLEAGIIVVLVRMRRRNSPTPLDKGGV